MIRCVTVAHQHLKRDIRDLMTLASLLLLRIATAQIAGGAFMSKVVSLCCRAVFGLPLMAILFVVPTNADTTRSRQPLAATATVINGCVLAVVDAVDSMSSAAIDEAPLIRARCRRGTGWRVEIDKSSDGSMKKVGHSGSGNAMRVIINF